MKNNTTVKCPSCGKEVIGLEREVRTVYPDDAAEIIKDDPDSKKIETWGPDFIRLGKQRYFVRVMLPVKLDVGHEFRFGVWMEVGQETITDLKKVWNSSEYVKVSFEGILANAVPPWGDTILGAECKAEVRDAKSVPFIKSSNNLELSEILSKPTSVHEIETVIADVWK